MKYRYTMSGPKAPRTFDEWVEAYEERDSRFVLNRGEKIAFHPAHGFFTYLYDAASGELLIPKMCGDGKYWRKQIYRLAKAARHLGVKGVLCCTKRSPVMYMHVIGGTLRRMEHVYDFATGKERTLWFIFVSWKDTKEGRREDDPVSDTDTDFAAGAAGD